MIKPLGHLPNPLKDVSFCQVFEKAFKSNEQLLNIHCLFWAHKMKKNMGSIIKEL